MPLRMIAFAFIVLSSGFPLTLAAQYVSQSATQVDTDRIDSRAFAILFKRENEYLRIAKTAKSSDSPEAQLSQAIPILLNLDSTQAVSLEHLAKAWESEIQPVRSQMMAEIASFHSSFPNGRLTYDIDPTPPVAIRTSRTQIDKITLRYRDLLRNSMTEPAFQVFQTQLRQSFGRNIDAGSRQNLEKGGNIR